jgi:hypothetical protein
MAKIHELYEDSYYENFTAGQYNDLYPVMPQTTTGSELILTMTLNLE